MIIQQLFFVIEEICFIKKKQSFELFLITDLIKNRDFLQK